MLISTAVLYYYFSPTNSILFSLFCPYSHSLFLQSAHTTNALVGTCRMGRVDDITAVVGADLRVHGLNRVRVADASVMPRIPGGQTAAPVVMIAEKAATFILSQF